MHPATAFSPLQELRNVKKLQVEGDTHAGLFWIHINERCIICAQVANLQLKK